MSTVIANLEQMPQPCGYFATVAWLVLAVLLSTNLEIGLLKRLDPDALKLVSGPAKDMRLMPYLVVWAIALIAVLAFAARRRHWRIKDYFGLVWPSNRQIGIALAILIVLLAAEEAVQAVTGWGSDYESNLYVAARAGGTVSLLWLLIASIVVFPIMEEMIFRGFLYRGWVRGPRTVVPGILIISALFAALHIQYDWFGIFIVFCSGLSYGVVRWWSGSTLLAILMHATTNLLATIEVVVGV